MRGGKGKIARRAKRGEGEGIIKREIESEQVGSDRKSTSICTEVLQSNPLLQSRGGYPYRATDFLID